MEGIIITDYFGPNNDNFNTNNTKLVDLIQKNEIEKKEDIKEDLPSDMEIIRTEKTSKIIIPEEIILDKKIQMN